MSISISALPSTKKMNVDANTSNIIEKAETRLCIIKQLAKLQVKQSTINLAYKTFLWKVFSIPTAYYLRTSSADNVSQWPTIQSCYQISQHADVDNISDIHQQHLKTKCPRFTCTENDGVLGFH